jgi:catechol 2,3-dioxygenase-like lactoylglutathione lyase family enzyme
MTSAQGRPVGLHHVQLAFPPGGQDRCREFWGGLLGLTEVEQPAVLVPLGGCWFRGDALEVHLGLEQDFRPAAKAHPAMLVDGLRALADRLEAGGVPVTWDTRLPGYERFYAQDPFGNRLEFLERSSGS